MKGQMEGLEEDSSMLTSVSGTGGKEARIEGGRCGKMGGQGEGRVAAFSMDGFNLVVEKRQS